MTQSISPEQAKSLLDSGHIGEDTYNQIVSAATPSSQDDDLAETIQQHSQPTADLGPGKKLDIEEMPNENDLKIQDVPQSEVDDLSRAPAGGSPVIAEQAPRGPVLTSDVANRGTQDLGDKRLNDYAANTDKAMSMAVEGTQKQAQAGIELGVKNAAALAGAQTTMKDMAAKSAAADILDKAELNESRQKAEQTMDWARQQATVDPGRFWGSRSTEQKIGLGISLFLGAFGGSNGNAAADVVKDAINRDIEAQKATANNAREIAAGRQSMYGKILEKVKDRHLAENMTRAALLDQAKLMTETQIAQYKGTEAQANGILGLSKIQMERATLQNDIDKQVYARHVMAGEGGGSPGADYQKIMVAAPMLGLKTEDVLKQYSEQKIHNEIVSNAMDEFQKEAKLNSFTGRAGNPIQSGAQIEASETNLMAAARHAFGERWNPEIEKTVKKTLPGLKDDQETLDVKANSFRSLLESNAPKDTGAIEALGLKKKPLVLGQRVSK